MELGMHLKAITRQAVKVLIIACLIQQTVNRMLAVSLQGLLGHLLFAEHITARWVLGIVLVISGLHLISNSVVNSSSSLTDMAATEAEQAGPQQQQGGKAKAS